MEGIPRIVSVEARGQSELLVRFQRTASASFTIAGRCSAGRSSIYFAQALFLCRASRMPGGYGISWNDDMDLSEYENI